MNIGQSLLNTFKRHWPEYLMEAWGLGMFMISACFFTVLLHHPDSVVPQAIPNSFIRMILTGIAMGLTAIVIIHSPTTIESALFKTYIEAEGYKNIIAMRKELGKESSPASEKYTRHLKAFVQVGKKRTDNYKKVLGQKIEIVPLENPYALTMRNELPVQVLFNGSPLSGVTILATYDSYSKKPDVYAQTMVTDSSGNASIKITNPGVWMIHANHMLPLKGDPQAEWESFWANLSFEVAKK